MSSTRKLIESIISNDYNNASENLSESFVDILTDKLAEVKKMVAAKYGVAELAEALESIDEANVTKMSRLLLIKARIRGGRVQRRVKKSAVKGMTFRGGKLVRMSPSERIARRRGRRRAGPKIRAKLARALMKRTRSLAKRKALGIR